MVCRMQECEKTDIVTQLNKMSNQSDGILGFTVIATNPHVMKKKWIEKPSKIIAKKILSQILESIYCDTNHKQQSDRGITMCTFFFIFCFFCVKFGIFLLLCFFLLRLFITVLGGCFVFFETHNEKSDGNG